MSSECLADDPLLAHERGKPAGSIRKNSILVAARDNWTRDLVTFVLHTFDFDTEQAANAAGAVDAAGAKRPDLILLDQDLDDLNCLSVCARMRGSHAVCAAPIIILTDQVAKIDLCLAQHLGVVGFLDKPIHMPDLTERVRTILPSRPRP
ncbi:response regulator [Actinoplanes palleronii]|uniref:Response regulatory domain-containing protein n=1 Tax=Actinoplanes palleronii TaxID=113570 RepID=A0ABQ4BFX2_9ACTN|nr:response regulator [Actinoplanes palleronii]GIE69495.1 hypothetical protein Apa02nite_056030 [Actinoplanes palleronii]